MNWNAAKKQGNFNITESVLISREGRGKYNLKSDE